MKKKYKIILGFIFFIVILISLFIEQSKPIKVSTLKIEKGNIYDDFKEEGIVKAKEEYLIYSKYGGIVKSISVNPGEIVKKGQSILELDLKDKEFEIKIAKANLKSAKGQKDIVFEDPLKSQVAIEESLLERAKIELKRAQRDYEIYSKLYTQGAISKSELDKYQDDLNSSQEALNAQQKALELLYESRQKTSGKTNFYSGNIEAVDAQIKYLEYQLENSDIKSPIDGMISDFEVKEGQNITPYEFIMSIYDHNNLIVETFVLSQDVKYLKLGQEVKLIQEGKENDVEFVGKIDSIAPNAIEKISTLGLEEQRVKINIKPEYSEDVFMMPGYQIECEFVTGFKSDVLIIPKTSIFKDKDVEMVWINQENKATIRKIVTGFENSTDIVVIEGLKEGDYIIINPQTEGLKEGKSIENAN